MSINTSFNLSSVVGQNSSQVEAQAKTEIMLKVGDATADSLSAKGATASVAVVKAKRPAANSIPFYNIAAFVMQQFAIWQRKKEKSLADKFSDIPEMRFNQVMEFFGDLNVPTDIVKLCLKNLSSVELDTISIYAKKKADELKDPNNQTIEESKKASHKRLSFIGHLSDIFSYNVKRAEYERQLLEFREQFKMEMEDDNSTHGWY